MKHILRIFPILAIAFTIICCSLNVAAYDYDSPLPFSNIGIWDGKVHTFEYMDVWKKTSLGENFTIDKGQHLKIEPIGRTSEPTDARLVITDGAEAVIKGEIFIERDGVLDVEDGTVVINGGNITNCGTIKIGKKGTLKILNGTLNSTAAGSIRNDGKITCMTSGKSLAGCFKSIKKYDGNFNLSDYTLSIDSDGSTAAVTANYCIGDIMTNYKYKFNVDTSSKKIKIVYTNYSLETVYKSKIPQKLQERVSSFEKKYADELNFDMWYWKDYGYTYNYKSDELTYSAKWIMYDYLTDKFIEKSFSEKA